MPRAMESLLERVNRIETLMTRRNEEELESRLPDLINVKEVGKLLGLTTSGIYAKVHRKEIPFIKLQDSNRVRFSRKQITLWLTESQQKAA